MARDQRGSTLLLFPVAILVVLLLGSIAVDSGATFLAQRELVDATQAAANDGATAGADVDVLRNGGGYRLDEAKVRAAVRAAFTAHGLGDARVEVTVVGDRVVVVAHRVVRFVLAPAVPGAPRTTTVSARSTGRPDQR